MFQPTPKAFCKLKVIMNLTNHAIENSSLLEAEPVFNVLVLKIHPPKAYRFTFLDKAINTN